MTSVDSLRSNFPLAVTTRRYLNKVRDAIEPLGFDRANTLPMVSVCRDELAQHLVSEVTDIWQRPFDLGGLAGFPPGGVETWQAGLTHVILPPDGRGKLLVVGMAHIGIAPDGTLGRAHRHGQSHTTPACGALGPIAALLADEQAARDFEPAPTEAGRLTKAIKDAISPDAGAPSIQELTTLCAQLTDDAIWADLEYLGVHTSTDVAVFTGVQIHLHDDADRIVPIGSTYKGEDGRLVALELNLMSELTMAPDPSVARSMSQRQN